MWRRELTATEIRFYKHATIAMADTFDLGTD
jgi:hypothetical protein